MFTSSPTFLAIFPRPGFSRERAGCPRCNPAIFRDPASAGSVPGGAPAMAGSTAPRERANRCTGRPGPAGNAHGVRNCISSNVVHTCTIHITRGRIAGPFCSAPALSRGSAELLSCFCYCRTPPELLMSHNTPPQMLVSHKKPPQLFMSHNFQ